VDLKLCLVDKLKTFSKNSKKLTNLLLKHDLYLPTLATLCLHAKLTVWGLGVMKGRPKSMPVSSQAQAPAEIFGRANLALTITENLEFFCLQD